MSDAIIIHSCKIEETLLFMEPHNSISSKSLDSSGKLKESSYQPGSLSIDFCIVLVIFAASYFCYSTILNCSFTCDDFIFIRHAYEVSDLSFLALLKLHCLDSLAHLFTNQLAYRPVPILWIVGMYKLFGASTLAFHAANIFIHALCAISSYYILKKLLNDFNPVGSNLTAAFAALLFATHPLHIEAVSWTAAQMDTFCTLFYLLAVLFYIASFEHAKRQRKIWIVMATVATFGSLLSKENGVTIPIVLGLYYAIFQSKESIVARVRDSLKQTWPFWLSVFIYFIFRTIALGTPIGGYYGVLEEGIDNIFWKWQNGHGFWLFVFPFNRELIPYPHPLYFILTTLYVLSASFYLFNEKYSPKKCSKLLKLSLFLFLWSIVCFAIGLVRWMIEPTLAGSRFAYLVSAPLLMLFAIAIVNPLNFDSIEEDSKFRISTKPLISIATAILFCIAFSLSTTLNLNAWLRASKTINSISDSIRKTVALLPVDKKLVILNLPSQVLGVHLFYHWNHLKCFIQPPFTDTNFVPRVDTPNRFIFLSNRYVSKARLRELSPSSKFYYFDNVSNKLREIKLENLDNKFLFFSLVGLDSNENAKEKFEFKAKDPAVLKKADFVELKLKCSNTRKIKAAKGQKLALSLNWQTKDNRAQSPMYIGLIDDGNWHRYRFPASENVGWLASRHTGLIWFSGSGYLNYRFGECSLIDDSNLVPELGFVGKAKRKVELYILPEKMHCKLSYDASLLEGADHVLLEISQPSDIFQTQGTSLRESSSSPSKVMTALKFKKLKDEVLIKRDSFPKLASYQFRISARSSSGKRIGYYSDPVDILLEPALW